MKKGKNKTTPKRVKRQKFSTILIKKAVVSLLICTMFCLISSALLMKDILASRTSMTATALSDLSNSLTEYFSQPDADTAIALNKLKWGCAVESETGCMVSVIYDLTTGEVIADSSRTAFLIVRNKDADPVASNARIYTCDYTALDVWKEWDADMALKPTISNLSRIYGPDSWTAADCESFYLKDDGTFLPGKGTLYTTSDDYDTGLDQEETIILTFDYTPADLSSYEKIEKGDKLTIMGPVIVGYEESLTETLFGFLFYPSRY